MENPYEKVQSNILSRIIGNVERLNESVVILNQELRRVNSKNKNLELMSQMCENYRESVDFQLQATSKKQEPL
ncbi:DASH complex subunit DAD4 [Kluyveromyces marxianus]|uniref:DASH complex subunit DAD4 n=2 Tax=Kluyveromyces marxianus TaxID=4911 RepID=W0TIX8_KLUMD|nr:DASH complex subunit DAD4 [Kluyveromyces marxianus DMKU3-1042]QGN18239.1 DASH complex subunit DAD4 [Kluyveromyces marxianus]BAO42104.1 DASH complex subunit DAD4 [Kluyveromyces marxianus DMKU3-1042]